MTDVTTKKMSLFSAVLIGTTSMVGSGWLFSAQLTARNAGNWAFLAWILAALLVLMIALCLGKVVSLYPVRGATTRSSAISHNNIFAMPFAFANWFGIVVVISSEALATTQYLAGVKSMDWLMDNNVLTTAGTIFSIFVLFIYLVINFYGVKLLSKVNNAITVFKMAVPAIIVIIFVAYALMHSNDHVSMFASDIPNNSQFGFSSALTAIVGGGLIYTFNGFQTVVAYASEVKNPGRNVPLAIVLALVLVLILYLGLQYAFMQAVPHEYLVSKGGWAGLDFESPLLQLATLLGLGYISFLLIIDSVISPSATGYSYLGASSRMLYAMSSEGQMPRYFAHITPKFNISRRSLLANFLLSIIFLLFSDNWTALMLVVTGFHIIGYMAAPISMGALAPKTRIYGLVVFIILTLLLNTVEIETNVHMSIILIILMTIYGSIEYRRIGLKNLLPLILPFIIFVCIVSPMDHYIIEGFVGAIFYWFVTDKRYVAFCKATANEKNIIVD
ncbi:amino acid transporter [Candidatus Francisella endociliophora]|uniref:Amino acid transporter n=1 Tax=Candidatus Francisella endociliophora TaxID=653937 RepID=A0A097ELZ6_9GAMM|nr:APC family permease [Francisella sp. FSC1006]AIT08591.1 amino acid transporter [Francisella sp. FSC1006]